MADQTILEGDGENTSPTQLPADIKEWTKEDVRQWIRESNVDEKYADILFKQEVNGESFLLCTESDFMSQGIPLGPTKLIVSKRDELVKLKASHEEKSGGHCSPYPFNRYHQSHRYRENSNLSVTETGTLDMIEPCHEFKAFNNTRTKEDQIGKFIFEVIRFGAACMNSRTNGTIHFGIGDTPDFSHGEILGFEPQDKEAFLTHLPTAIEKHFKHKHKDAAKKCIKTPRFVEVLNPDMTFSKKYVLEVDIKPDSSICKENLYKVSHVNKGKQTARNEASEEKDFLYIRENTQTLNLLATPHQKRLTEYTCNISLLSDKRKKAEDNRLDALKTIGVQGFKLCEMLTGGTNSLDKSHYQHYILVANKSHPVQRESLSFLCEMKLAAILDFDPESAENGLKTVFEDENTNVHSPVQYKIETFALDIASKLKLTRTTSWVFCNGTINSAKTERPSETDSWSIEKGSAVRDVVSFLCRKDVLPPKKFLVVFMLFSDVTDNKDPLLKTFNMFLEELKGFEQLLCICENEHIFKNWIQLTEHSCGINISNRCIYELSFAEVNGTVLSLWSRKRRSCRFLPGGGGSQVELSKKMEGRLDTLDILCVNQCQDEELNEEAKASIENNFYRGDKVAWWNFQLCEESKSFIKRDKFDYIVNTIIPDMCSLSETCALVNIVHLPGCGGTTLAMHILWELKNEFRCAVLMDGMADHSEVAKQVKELFSLGTEDKSPPLSVLLMIDNFDDMDGVYNLKLCIEDVFERYLESDFVIKKPQVIILNCMRTEHITASESTEDTVFLRDTISELELKKFDKKLLEIGKSNTASVVKTFYGFMIMKENFSQGYIEDVARHILKNFDINHKGAEVFAVLILLDFYSKKASLSIALCEELLHMTIEPNSTVEDGFGRFSPLLTRCWVKGKVVFESMRVIHSKLAEYCLNELKQYKVSKADITLLLLTQDMYFECILGTDKLKQAIHDMLIKRNPVAGGKKPQFSQLIQTIDKETRSSVETVLLNAEKRFQKNAVISQLLARYYSLKKKDFRKAKKWAKMALEVEPQNSYMADTFAQVMKCELWENIKSDKESDEKLAVTPEKLSEHLKMAEKAITAFRKSQATAEREATRRFRWRDDKPYNTAGHLGEVQVAMQVLDVLERIPLFSNDQKKLSDFLSKKVKLQDIISNDIIGHKSIKYNKVLQQFEAFLQTLQYKMKIQFIFFDSFLVNLHKRFDQQDTLKERTGEQISKYFDRYANLFCQQNADGNGNVSTLNMHLSLEKDKADTHNRLLNHLSNLSENEDKINSIFKNYDSIIQCGCCSTLDKAHLIYASIILNCVNPTSVLKRPYSELLDLLRHILGGQILPNESMAVHFLAMMMLWPEETHLNTEEVHENYEWYITQLKDTFDKEMTPVNVGMWPVVHFFLGNKPNYGRLVCRKEINKCVKPEETASIWKNGRIRKHEKVKQLLLEVTGKISRNYVLADTTDPNVKPQVIPFSRGQLIGREGSRVTFYVGFSMKGPIAFDVNLM